MKIDIQNKIKTRIKIRSGINAELKLNLNNYKMKNKTKFVHGTKLTLLCRCPLK